MTPKFWCGPTDACMPAEYFDQWASANHDEARIWAPLFTADQVAEAVMEERERCAVLAETSHPHDWAFIGAAIRNVGA